MKKEIKKDYIKNKKNKNNLNIKKDEIKKIPNIIKRKKYENERMVNQYLKILEYFEKRIINIESLLQNNNRESNESPINFELEEILKNKDFIKNNNDKKCLICLENYCITDKICYLSCLHFFHSSCIKSWIKLKNRCPLCNHNL